MPPAKRMSSDGGEPGPVDKRSRAADSKAIAKSGTQVAPAMTGSALKHKSINICHYTKVEAAIACMENHPVLKQIPTSAPLSFQQGGQ